MMKHWRVTSAHFQGFGVEVPPHRVSLLCSKSRANVDIIYLLFGTFIVPPHPFILIIRIFWCSLINMKFLSYRFLNVLWYKTSLTIFIDHYESMSLSMRPHTAINDKRTMGMHIIRQAKHRRDKRQSRFHCLSSYPPQERKSITSLHFTLVKFLHSISIWIQ